MRQDLVILLLLALVAIIAIMYSSGLADLTGALRASLVWLFS